MTRFVIDASVTIAGLSPDEAHHGSRELVERAIVDGAVAPALWPFEVANILTLKFRRGLISAESRSLAFLSIRDLKMTIEASDLNSVAFDRMIALADTHRLTVYDAAYLEVALRLSLPLASLDRALVSAARAEGVAIA